MTSLSIKVQDACGARAPGFRPLGPIPHRPSLGCPGAAVEPFDGPAFELLVVSVWCQPSGVELLGHHKSAMLLSRRASSRRLTPEREGQVVVVA
jgi:hypothetical protein